MVIVIRTLSPTTNLCIVVWKNLWNFWILFFKYSGFLISWCNCIDMKAFRKRCAKSLDRKVLLTQQNKRMLLCCKISDWIKWLKYFRFRCNIDNKNLLPFQLLFVVGICFLSLSALSSFYLKKIEPKKLVCKNCQFFIIDLNHLLYKIIIIKISRWMANFINGILCFVKCRDRFLPDRD